MDEINSRDTLYRKEMEQGSYNLLKAIEWARKGYNPATSEKAFRLPPDYSEREAPKYSDKPKTPRAMPSVKRIREMMERGMKASEIASVLKQSRQRVEAIMRKIKLERRSEDFGQRYQQDRWG